MKRLPVILLLLAQAACTPQNDLSRWTMRQEGSSQRYEVSVPCTVAGALNQAGAFGPDVLEERRYESIDRTQFELPWVFTTRFKADKNLHHVLRFNGLGYAADIELNGRLLASADTCIGPFAVREFDISPYARGRNLLRVRVHRAPAAGLNTGYVDWNPRPVDESMGILRDVELLSTPDVLVSDVFIKPILDPADLSRASLELSVTLVNLSDRSVSGELTGTFDTGVICEKVELGPRETRTVTSCKAVENPRIWWTREMGRPELYTMDVSFCADGHFSHSKAVRFGIRCITSELTDEGHRLFRLNGRPLLIKAAGWTDDIFQQDSPSDICRQVEMVADMGLNCIRFENIWGKDDSVYNACDSLGILALAGFSCQWEWEIYCGIPATQGFGCINRPEWEDLAVRYFRDQVIRLRNHPSLAAWLTGSDFVPNPRLEERYLDLYGKLDYRPYVCSAKKLSSFHGGPSGLKMEGPYEYVPPEYWYLDTRHGGAYGFNSETGIGMNIPQRESLIRTVGPAHLWPPDGNWDFHCTASSEDMNSTRTAVEATTELYGAPTGFEDFVRKAHALDYDGTRAMFEAFRCRVPHATGIVQWMLNSAWPSLYWQLYDWYLVPTAGYFGTKKACSPLQLVYDYGHHNVWAVNDALPATRLTARMIVFGPDSRVIRREEKACLLSTREPAPVFRDIHGPCFLSLELLDDSGQPVADNFYCIPAQDNRLDWDRTLWYRTPVAEYAHLRFVTELPPARVEMIVQPLEDGFSVRVSNCSEVIAYQLILKAENLVGRLLPGVLWSDNFFALAPGESRTVRCDIPGGRPEDATVSLDGWNLE